MEKIRLLNKNEKEKNEEICIYNQIYDKKIAFNLDFQCFFEKTYDFLYSEMPTEINFADFLKQYDKQLTIITYQGFTRSLELLINLLNKNTEKIEDVVDKLLILEPFLEELIFNLSKYDMLLDAYDILDTEKQIKKMDL